MDSYSSILSRIFASRLVFLLFVKRALYPVNVIGVVFIAIQDMINTWEELRTRNVHSFIDPLHNATEGMTEDEAAKWWDEFDSEYFGVEVNVHRYELEQERRRQTLKADKPTTRFFTETVLTHGPNWSLASHIHLWNQIGRLSQKWMKKNVHTIWINYFPTTIGKTFGFTGTTLPKSEKMSRQNNDGWRTLWRKKKRNRRWPNASEIGFIGKDKRQTRKRICLISSPVGPTCLQKRHGRKLVC